MCYEKRKKEEKNVRTIGGISGRKVDDSGSVELLAIFCTSRYFKDPTNEKKKKKDQWQYDV